MSNHTHAELQTGCLLVAVQQGVLELQVSVVDALRVAVADARAASVIEKRWSMNLGRRGVKMTENAFLWSTRQIHKHF